MLDQELVKNLLDYFYNHYSKLLKNDELFFFKFEFQESQIIIREWDLVNNSFPHGGKSVFKSNQQINDFLKAIND